ncbi:hypothetical protein LINGRAHAP2_LOCUS14653 [Linum grandiflorum]
MVVWVRFSRLPYHYYHQDKCLGNLVGEIVRPDLQTQNSVRGKFVRIAVKLDLSESPLKVVFVDGVWQVVENENLSSFCRGCGRFGHELVIALIVWIMCSRLLPPLWSTSRLSPLISLFGGFAGAGRSVASCDEEMWA